MPTYVYRRPDGTTFEAFQSISAPALTEDPETGVPVTRVISGGAGLQFKGDGFYITDYVAKSGEKADSGESSTESKSKAATAKPASKKAAATSASNTGGSKKSD